MTALPALWPPHVKVLDEDMETLVKAVAGTGETRPPIVAVTAMVGGSKEMAVPPPETDVPLILTSPAFRVPAT